MNINLLVDAIVRQTTILIARLATAAGARASLAHTANQVFYDLVRELREQGLTNSLIADMFGLSLRTYHNKVRRLAESRTERGRSLWEAVLSHVEQRESVRRTQVLEHFASDDEAAVRSVLGDLVDSGLVLQGGRGERVVYRIAQADDDLDDNSEEQAVACLVWVTVARHRRIGRAALLELLPVGEEALKAATASLAADGRITVSGEGADIEYASKECVIAVGEPVGWEASLFNHYQAMVAAICAKLERGQMRALPGDWIGGSTYDFDVWPGHPLHDQVVGLLNELRQRVSSLRVQVDTYNATTQIPEQGQRRVITYLGQTVIDSEERPEGTLP